ncbi:MAG: S41 family peptidase [Planctomycetales bacterium]|nr:S41 family peptidase [Planctomycetales bacterium]MCA9226380.1 S41 family peptidase [Planctomycetales bacterium]
MHRRFRVSMWAFCLAGAGLFLNLATVATYVRADEPAATNSEAKATDSADTAKAAEEAAKQEAEAEARRKQAAEEIELLRLFADTFAQIRGNYVKEVSDRELMEAAIQGMMSKLDPYSDFIPPTKLDRFRSGVENEFGGIGIQVSTSKGELEVISPLVGSPAYKAGISAGDVITAIDGKPTKGVSIDEAVKMMKGPIGTQVRVMVRHPGEDEEDEVALKRAIIRVETVLGDHRNDDDSWNFFLDEEKKIGYVRISSFGRHTADELRDALKQLKADEMKSLVLDLRFNPGGLLSSAIEICDLFVKEGRIVSTSGRNVAEHSWDAHEAGTYSGFPMVVLVNGFSASASEIVSACLQDHDRAVVIGERTFGKGSVQNIIDLENGRSALKLTTAGYMRPSGKNIHRFPDAKDSDEWGVSPNDGFAIKLERDELDLLIKARAKRDLVVKKLASKETDEPKSDDATEETSDDAESDAFIDRQLEAAVKYFAEKSSPEQPAAEKSKTDEAETVAARDEAK